MEGFTFTPQLGLIIGSIVGLSVGWVIGYFDSNNRTAKKIQAAEANAEIAIKDAENKIAEANQQIARASQTSQAAPDDPGLLRVKNNQGRYTLEVDGASISGALPSDQKKRLIELLTIIRPYLEGGQPPAAPQPVAPISPPPVAVIQPTAPPAQPAPVAAKEEAPALASNSMVGQIDGILQARMMNTPLAKKGIRLHESSGGGVEVYVGLQKFDAIDDVPDETVKAAIRAAIAEWEKKYTPKI